MNDSADLGLVETRHPVHTRAVTLRLNRPAARNAVRPEDVHEFQAALARLQSDPKTTVIFITGSGSAFTAGADIHSLNALAGEELTAYLDATTDILTRILMMQKVVIALVNGSSAGLGNHIAACADLCFIHEDAAFHFTGSAKAIPSMLIGAAVMPLSIGMKRAKALYLRGGKLGAQQAVDAGLCNERVTAAEWPGLADSLAAEFQDKSSLTLAHNKFQVNQAAYQMLAASRLSVLAGSVALSGMSRIAPGRVQ